MKVMLFFLPLLLIIMHSGCSSQQSRPNILFIMSDDHSTSTIGAYGSWLQDNLETPHIDALAAEGMRFDHCFATNSICTPSRATILTGQYGHLNGVRTLDDTLSTARENVGKVLQRNGYQTAVIGKWHLKADPSGFDYWNVLPGQGRYHDPVMKEIGAGEFRTYDGFSTDVITDLSMDWLNNRNTEQPFFLMC